MECMGSWNDDCETLAKWEKMGLRLPTINDIVCDLEHEEFEDDLLGVLKGADIERIALGIAVAAGVRAFRSAIEFLRRMDMLPDG